VSMSDGRAFDDQGLPWLEAVDDEDGPRGVSARKMFVALLMVLLAAAIVAGTFFWIGRRDTPVAGPPELIKADPAPYKIKPDDPGGLDVAGESGTAFSTSAGEDPDSALDMNRLPHGVEVPPPVAEPASGAAVRPAPAKPVPDKPKPAEADPGAAASGPTVQLGAYASTIKADTAWGMLSSRFPAVSALGKTVVGASVGGKTVYRLRATGTSEQTRAACAALKAAGESCLVVN
jgi:SPOR domain